MIDPNHEKGPIMNTSTIERSAAHEAHAVIDQAWSVGRGQHVQLVRPGLRRRTIEAAVVRGTLAPIHGSTDGPAGSLFELVIALPRATDRPITISSETARSMRLVSQGVFRQRGRPPSLWLTIWAEVELPELRGLTGRGEIVVTADLNLNPAAPTFG
jgi:hypothetical protein